jgi:hypothetical protein
MVFGASSNSSATADGYLPGHGLTINTYTPGRLSAPTKPNLFLGDLKAIDQTWSGHGRYCDHVYLRGALTTAINSGAKFAGINTSSGCSATIFEQKGIKFGDEFDTSKIVVWGGANGDDITSIQGASF